MVKWFRWIIGDGASSTCSQSRPPKKEQKPNDKKRSLTYRHGKAMGTMKIYCSTLTNKPLLLTFSLQELGGAGQTSEYVPTVEGRHGECHA
jgi:hypothetical protein